MAVVAFLLPLKAEFNPAPLVLPQEFVPHELGAPFLSNGTFLEGDLDADGLKDVVVHFPANGLYWCHALGATDLTEPPLAAPQLLCGLEINSPRLGDIDGDGYPDLVGRRTIQSGLYEIFWVRNLCGENGTVAFETTHRTITTSIDQLRGLYLEDIDCDNDLDVLAYSHYASERFHFVANHPGAIFGTPTTLFVSGRYATDRTLTFCDFDSDGDPDMATLLTNSNGKDTILWIENRIINTADHSLILHSDLDTSGQLPESASTPTLVIARIKGELWFRFLTSEGISGTYRENELAAQASDLTRLKAILDSYWSSTPDAFSTRQILNQATKICLHRTGTSVQVTIHPLLNTYLPGSDQTRYYSPDEFLSGDLDGDGDSDLFTAYFTAFYGPYCGWFENRLNEPSHADFAQFRELDLERYDGSGVLSDLDGNGIAEIAYKSRDKEIRVLYNANGLESTAAPWTEVVQKQSLGTSGSTPDVKNFLAIDLDGDGDKELASDAITYPSDKPFLLLSENLAGEPDSLFSRHETNLITGKPSYTNYPYIRAEDRDADGDLDISLGTAGSFRNDRTVAPSFGYVQDAGLGTFSEPPANDPALIAEFDSWLAARPWQGHGQMFTRFLADIDLDGDPDVIAYHGLDGVHSALSWYENLGTTDSLFRGPFGVTNKVGANVKIAGADYDSDGDTDILAIGYTSAFGGSSKLMVFENRSSPADWVDRLIEDDEGFFRNSFTSARFRATLECSEDLNWASAEKIPVPVTYLGNSEALKHLMQWQDPTRPKRFYRLSYTLAK